MPINHKQIDKYNHKITIIKIKYAYITNRHIKMIYCKRMLPLRECCVIQPKAFFANL